MISQRSSSSSSRASIVTIVGATAILAVALFIVAMDVLFLLNGRVAETAFSLIPLPLIVDLALVGGLIALKRPGNVIGWLLVGMLYGMGKFVFVAATADLAASGSEAAAAGAAASEAAPRLPTRLVRLAGHADVRWHLWIVLAALGRLELALAAYAVYFPGRAVLAAGRKAVRRG